MLPGGWHIPNPSDLFIRPKQTKEVSLLQNTQKARKLR